MRIKTRILVAALALDALARPAPTEAATQFDPTTLQSLTNQLAESLITQVGITGDHRAFEPASPLGLAIGLDVGVDTTASKMSQSFKDALTTAGVTGSKPDYIVLPRLNVHKGLPLGIDVGFSYVGYQKNSIYAGEAKYAFLRGGVVKPSVAARVSYTSSTLYFMKTHTTKIDVLASKTVGWFLEPYVGTGVQLVSGTVEVPVGVPGLPATVSASQSKSAMHVYGGLPIKLIFLHLTGEYDYSFTGITTAGLKVSFNF
jgi:hypothetical protein